MTDYVTMRNRILDDLVNESITVSQVNNAIQSSIRKYERKKFYFNQKIATFSTVADSEYYQNADGDEIEIISMAVTTSGYKRPVTAKDYTIIDENQDGTIKGVPCNFSYYQQSIRLYPMPDAVYTVTLSYHCKLPALSADSDSNAWTTDAEELIRQAAKLRLAIDVLQAPDLAEGCGLLIQSALEDLQAETRRRMPQMLLQMPHDLQPIGPYNFYTDGYH